MNAITPFTAANPAAALIPRSMSDAMELANMMSRGELVPKHLQDKPGDCLLIIEQSMRWQMSPFAVAQETSVIQGKLMFSGKLVAAALHSSGALAGRLSYAFEGDAKDRAVIVMGTLRGESEPRTVRVALADAKTENKIWGKQTDQQLVYHGARVWARRHAPEVIMGVYAPEEFDEAVAHGPTIQGEAVSSPMPEAKLETLDHVASAPPRSKADDAADAIIVRLAKVITGPQFHAVVDDPMVQSQRQWLAQKRGDLSDRVETSVNDAAERLGVSAVEIKETA